MNSYQLKEIDAYFKQQSPEPHARIFIIIFILSLLFFLLFQNCKKFVGVDPPKTELVSTVVFSNDASAKAAMDGIYSRMISSSGFASGGTFSLATVTGLSSDELANYSASAPVIQFYQNVLLPTNSSLQSFVWAEPYQYIYTANAIIEGLTDNPNVSDVIKQELTGEAKFIRAYCYFYLVNLFGEVPLNLSTDYRQSSIASRRDKSTIYQQIIDDLKSAQNALYPDYSFSNNERVRPNRSAATALLARAYLFTGDWVNAEIQTNSIIANPLYSIVTDFNKVFFKNSTEAIWQLMPSLSGYNTNEGRTFILTGIPSNYALSSQLLNSFEPGDKRQTNWTGSVTVGGKTYYFPYKYKVQSGSVVSEYSMVLRLAEIYLIRAEARTNLNHINEAQSDINVIRARAGLPNTSADTQATLLAAIMQERRAELFTESGHRWLDLKRTGRADSTLAPLKGANWQSTDVLYPIPQQEIQNNTKMTQNPGY